MKAACEASGFSEVVSTTEIFAEKRVITRRQLDAWFGPDSAYGRSLRELLPPSALTAIRDLIDSRLAGRELDWPTTVAFLTATR